MRNPASPAQLSPPLIHSVKANYSAEAIKARYEGVYLIQLVVDTDGSPTDVRIIRPLGMHLDKNAIRARPAE